MTVLQGTGTGALQSSMQFQAGNGSGANSNDAQPVTSGDFDGDGKPDLAVAVPNSNAVSVLRNTTETIAADSFRLVQTLQSGASPSAVSSADFNGDGKPDLAVANREDGTLSVLLGTGVGTLGPKADFLAGSSPRGLTIAELRRRRRARCHRRERGLEQRLVADGDRHGRLRTQNPTSDVFGWPESRSGDERGANNAGASVSVMREANLPGTFMPRSDFATGTGPRAVASADFNADGKPDLVTVNDNDNLDNDYDHGKISVR